MAEFCGRRQNVGLWLNICSRICSHFIYLVAYYRIDLTSFIAKKMRVRCRSKVWSEHEHQIANITLSQAAGIMRELSPFETGFDYFMGGV